MPILAIHAPVLLLTTNVWGRDPGREAAEGGRARGRGGRVVRRRASAVPVAGLATPTNFERIVREVGASTGVEICVENMFPWKIAGKSLKAYAPSPDPLDLDVAAMTLDFSHASLSGRDSLELAMAMGDRLRHVHLCDGTRSADQGNMFDEHLAPGRGTPAGRRDPPVSRRQRMVGNRCGRGRHPQGAQLAKEARPADRDGGVRPRTPVARSRRAGAPARCPSARRVGMPAERVASSAPRPLASRLGVRSASLSTRERAG